jgi:hypothetical protein
VDEYICIYIWVYCACCGLSLEHVYPNVFGYTHMHCRKIQKFLVLTHVGWVLNFQEKPLVGFFGLQKEN